MAKNFDEMEDSNRSGNASIHEVSDPARLLSEIAALLRPGGTLFISEPTFYVSGKEFRKTLELSEEAGFETVARRLLFVNRAAVMRRKR